MNTTGTSDLNIREPSPAELQRVIHLFRGVRLRPKASLLAAVRSLPVERFVGAAAWWPVGNIAYFQLAAQPGKNREEACARLINHLVDGVRPLGLQTLQYGDLVPDTSEWLNLLLKHGFTHQRSERFFEVSSHQSWTRTMEFYERYKSRIPTDWRTEPIRDQAPEVIMDLIDPYRLMPPSELRDHWRADADFGFDLDMSSILFDGSRPVGTLLTRRVGDALCVDIRVVRMENQLHRAMGNILLFYHMAVRKNPDGPIRRLQFRGGATEHRETANLALRMGGHELPPRHVYSKTL